MGRTHQRRALRQYSRFIRLFGLPSPAARRIAAISARSTPLSQLTSRWHNTLARRSRVDCSPPLYIRRQDSSLRSRVTPVRRTILALSPLMNAAMITRSHSLIKSFVYATKQRIKHSYCTKTLKQGIHTSLNATTRTQQMTRV